MDNKEAKQIWAAALGKLEIDIPRTSFKTYLKNTTAAIGKDKKFTIFAPTIFHQETLKKRLAGSIHRALEETIGESIEVKFGIQGAVNTNRVSKKALPGYEFIPNPFMTFKNFVVGSCNNMAVTAARFAASKEKKEMYNPLYIVAAAGMGKTHLLHAAVHLMRQQGINPIYVTGEKFTNDYVRSARTKSADKFREKYVTADALLIDDLEFLEGKAKTQIILLSILDEYLNSGKKVMVSAEMDLTSLPLKEKIRARLAKGCSVKINSVSEQTAKDIARQHARHIGVPMSEATLDVIGVRRPKTPTEIIGLVNQLSAEAALGNSLVSPEVVRETLDALANSNPRNNQNDLNYEKILQAIAQATDVSAKAITGRSRERHAVEARWLAMYLMTEVCSITYKRTGEILGKRNFQTIMHGHKKYKSLIQSDPKAAAILSRTKNILGI